MLERDVEFQTDLSLRRTRTIQLDQGDPDQKREEIRNYFHASFDIDEALLQTLAYDETFYRRADPLRHPLIFYFGHTATFYVNKLLMAKLIEQRLDPKLESMFAVGVDEMSWDDLNTDHYDWPSPPEVQAYRDRLRALVDDLISTLPLTLPITWDSPFWIIMMGIEHSRIHLETSSVLIRQLPLDHVRSHPLWQSQASAGPTPVNEFLDVSAGTLTLGKTRKHALYGWDNEYGGHEENIPAFRAAKYLVSNGEYHNFVADGGYGEDQWWTSEGRGWRDFHKAAHPRFWIRRGDEFLLRLMLEEIPMPWDWPVEVNQLEAKAFCNWMAARLDRPIRLPTEAEWVLLRDRTVKQDQPYWDKAPGNINLEHYASPCPVNTFAFDEFYDVIGNVWQWTETPISGFRGFEVHPAYDDFSTPTFDTQHNLMKGGSWISTGNEATRDARYAFRRHFYQHAGFRPVESEAAVNIVQDVYETDAMLCQYCDFHYGDTHFGVPNFPKVLAERCLDLTDGQARGRALDLGCSVGRATFELARGFQDVTGLDFSANFIRIGVELQERGRIQYTRQDEGELSSFVECHLEDLDLGHTPDRVSFFQADACNMKDIHTGYDLILAANLIDRLYAPRKFLETIHTRLNPGGTLVLASPYTWLEDYTERPEWIGGFRKDGEPYTTLDALQDILSPRFEMIAEPEDIPFVIRETKRKFQHSIAQLTAWKLPP